MHVFAAIRCISLVGSAGHICQSVRVNHDLKSTWLDAFGQDCRDFVDHCTTLKQLDARSVTFVGCESERDEEIVGCGRRGVIQLVWTRFLT